MITPQSSTGTTEFLGPAPITTPVTTLPLVVKSTTVGDVSSLQPCTPTVEKVLEKFTTNDRWEIYLFIALAIPIHRIDVERENGKVILTYVFCGPDALELQRKLEQNIPILVNYWDMMGAEEKFKSTLRKKTAW